MAIRDEMPVLARHEGEWTGHYLHVDAEGRVLDRHEARLSCTFPDEGEFEYLQINRYHWDDGREEVINFPAHLSNGELVFDTDRMLGYAREIDDRTIVLTWSYRWAPESYLYEMIQISADNAHRARTWHWFEGDRCVKRTLISEHRLDARP